MDKPLRVLMMSDVYFPRVNGVSTSIRSFRDALPAHGVVIRLVVPDYPGAGAQEGIRRIASRAVPRDPEDRLMAWGALRDALHDAATGWADLVHVQTPFLAQYAGVGLARRMGIPVVATYHTFFEHYFEHYLPWLPAGLLRRVARRVSRSQCNALDAVVVPSTPMRDALKRYGVSRPMHVLPTGLPQDAFRRGDGARFRAAHGIAPTRPLLLFVGRVAFEKNIDFLFDVLRALQASRPDALLVIAGEGPALPALRARAQREQPGASVHFVGYLDRENELPDCYASADAFVFSSLTETQGLVLLEAMAQARPVVALSAMGTADVLLPASGAFTPRADPAAFAAQVDALLALPARARAELGAQALAYAQGWSASGQAGRLAALYRSLVSP
jgi:1,2-diacylglycerol 3-alpha-glucosyltransferase